MAQSPCPRSRRHTASGVSQGDHDVIKEDTASTFVFHRFPREWRLGLIEHPRLGLHMLPGGHRERGENVAEAAERELAEETGLEGAQLVSAPAPGLPAGYPHPSVARPWWVTEIMVGPDSHVTESHVHVDHQFLSVASSAEQTLTPAHPFDWYTAADLADLKMPADTRLLADLLFTRIDVVATGALDAAALLRTFAITATA
jgi:8-oxo-dGTP pyrophosphatase MutT (NUDIX family)